MALGALFNPIIKVGSMFMDILKLVFTLLKWFPKLIDIVVNLLNPVVFIKDILSGVFKGLELIVMAFFDILVNTPREKGDKTGIGKGGIFPNGVFGTNNKDGTPQPNATCVPPSTLKLILMVFL